MKLKNIISKIDVWDGWRDAYNKFVPQFIEEAKSKSDWKDWNKEIFREFFERSSGQCISSLKQGYFTKEEQTEIKKNWNELSPFLKQIADSQDAPLWNTYSQIETTIRKYTKVNRRASTYRLIASLQPKLLCTIVNHKNLNELLDYLNKNGDPEENVPRSTWNWFKDSHAILNFYKENSNIADTSQLITYPWQTMVFFKEDFDKNKERDMSEILNKPDSIIELLQYKKQIILQGPPGTGKTYNAKRLAENIVLQNMGKINVDFIKEKLHVGFTIDNLNDKDKFEITKKDANFFLLKPTKGKEESIRFDHILEFIEEKKWESTAREKHLDSYKKIIGKYIYEKKYNFENFIKLIQFHPSYTYEDFVRGITAKTNDGGNGIEYITENKILAKIAKEANQNFINSKKDQQILSKEKWLNEQFELFVDFISDKIEEEGKIELTESVFIIELDEDAFRYKGSDGWSKKGNRMLFNDIKQAYLDKNIERQHVKHNQNLSGLAKWHASYYIRVLGLFRKYLNDNKIIFTANTTEKEELKNYVLIIDEINRANLSSVLGELIYALEYRGEKVESLYDIDGDNSLIIPPNLYMIGTMNTSDRSVGHIDYAIRRRFAFVDVLPEIEPISTAGIDKFKTVCELFIEDFDTVDWNEPKFKASKHLSREFKPKDVILGHSYFITKDKDDNGKQLDEMKQMELKLKYEIVPILKEYIKDGILKESKEVETIIDTL